MAFWKKIFKKEDGAGATAALPAKAFATETAPMLAKDIGSAPDARDLFFASHLTEKTNTLQTKGQYVFAVSSRVTKYALSRAIARRYGVAVEAVRMLNMPGKERRRGRIMGWKPGFKKAVVTIKKGQTLELS